MTALNKGFVSMLTRSATLPLLTHLLSNFLDDFGYLSQHLVGIEMSVPFLDAIERGPAALDPFLTEPLILVHADNGRDRLPVLDENDRLMSLLHRSDDVVEFGLRIFS